MLSDIAAILSFCPSIEKSHKKYISDQTTLHIQLSLQFLTIKYNTNILTFSIHVLQNGKTAHDHTRSPCTSLTSVGRWIVDKGIYANANTVGSK